MVNGRLTGVGGGKGNQAKLGPGRLVGTKEDRGS